MSTFPTALVSLTDPTSTNYLNSPAHATQHANANDEIGAIEAKVGIDSSTVTTTHDYKLTPRIITLTDGATVTIDLSKRGINQVTLGGNRILAISNETVGQVFILRIVQGGGSNTVTWFSTISWAGGSAPTLTTTAGKADVFAFIVTSSGNYNGFVVGLNL